MLFMEIITVCCETRKKRINTWRRKDAEQDANFTKLQAMNVKCKTNTTGLSREEY